MIDNIPEKQSEKEQPFVKKRPPVFAIAFLYIMGFFITQKSDYDSSTILGIAMLVFGWLCMLMSMFLSITVFFRLFKEYSKKK
jgi:choline-glycine betaine transporter